MPRMTDRSDGRSAAFCHSPRSHDRAVAPAVFVFLLAPSSAARPAPNAAPTRGQQFPIRRHWRYAVSGQHDIKRRSFARSSAACSPRRILMDQLHELYYSFARSSRRKVKLQCQSVRLYSGSARACSSWPQW